MATTLGLHNHHSSRTERSAIELPDGVRTIPELFNEAGLRQISFDGLEGNRSTGMGNEAIAAEAQRLRDKGRAMLATPDRSTGRVLYEGACAGGAQAAGRSG